MKKDNLAPIVLFAYNRPDHIRKTIGALQKNELASESELFVFSDAPKNSHSIPAVKEVRNFIKTISGFKSVHTVEREENYGLAKSIIDGVTKIINEYGKIIVLEDDLVTSPYFLKYMNDALKMYETENNVACIHGYIFPIEGLPETFFIRGADCWGWGTWKRAWDIFEVDGQKLLIDIEKRGLQKEVDYNNSYSYTQMLKDQIAGKNDSWAVRWYVSAFMRNMLCLYPGKSYVQNIGFDNEGTHTNTPSTTYNVVLNNQYSFSRVEPSEDLISKQKIEYFYKSIKHTFLKKIRLKIRQLLK